VLFSITATLRLFTEWCAFASSLLNQYSLASVVARLGAQGQSRGGVSSPSNGEQNPHTTGFSHSKCRTLTCTMEIQARDRALPQRLAVFSRSVRGIGDMPHINLCSIRVVTNSNDFGPSALFWSVSGVFLGASGLPLPPSVSPSSCLTSIEPSLVLNVSLHVIMPCGIRSGWYETRAQPHGITAVGEVTTEKLPSSVKDQPQVAPI